MTDEMFIYVNGEYLRRSEAKVSVFDRGILYGDGFFEGIRIYNGKIFMEQSHIDRFFDSAKYTNILLGYSKEDISEIMHTLIDMNGIKDGYIRLVATRGEYNLGLTPPDSSLVKPTLICIASNIKLYDDKYYLNGVSVIISSFMRMSPSMFDVQCKSLNYMSNILARMEANSKGAQEAIFVNNNGVVTECTGDNIFIIKDNIVYTPPSHTGILNGVTRLLVINLLKEAGYEVHEREFTRYNLYTADECFLTGTAAEVIGVVDIDNRTIGNGEVGYHTKKVMKLFKDYINKVC